MNCTQCNKATKNKKFCCRSCAGQWNNNNPTEKALSKRRKLSKKCDKCGDPILSNRKFCKKCLKKRPYKTHQPITTDEEKKAGLQRCSKCRQVKAISEFYTNHPYCKECNNKHTIGRQRKVKQFLIDYKGGRCQHCGYNECAAAFDFHHLDPSAKDFNISRLGTRSIKSDKMSLVLKEIDKCLLLCSNCHRKLHYLQSNE